MADSAIHHESAKPTLPLRPALASQAFPPPTNYPAPALPFFEGEIGLRRLERFWSKVDIRGHDECWPWQAGLSKEGYGKFRGEARNYMAHRYSWLASRGPIPKGLLIRHMVCGYKPCVNPAHLMPGTFAENSEDAARLGELTLGSRNGMSKIVEADAAYIIANPDNLDLARLAERFGIAVCTVGQIRSGERWGHMHLARERAA